MKLCWVKEFLLVARVQRFVFGEGQKIFMMMESVKTTMFMFIGKAVSAVGTNGKFVRLFSIADRLKHAMIKHYY